MADQTSGITPSGGGAIERPGQSGRRPSLPQQLADFGQRRPAASGSDPTDVDAAVRRLSRLLSGDSDGPRQNVPRGYYVNILV